MTKVSILSNAPTHPGLNTKKNDKKWVVAIIFYWKLQMVWLIITLPYTEFITSGRQLNSSILYFTLSVCWNDLCSFFLANNRSWAYELSGLSTLYRNRVKHFFLGTVNNVNHLVSQFELFIYVFGDCWCQHREQVFLSTEIFCCNDQLIPQAHEMVEICISHCKILDHAKVYVVIFLEHLKFYIQVIGIVFGPKKLTKSVLTFWKVHIGGTSEFFEGSSSVVCRKIWSLR